MRQPIGELNAIAVSALLKETALNTEQTLSNAFVVAPNVLVKLKQNMDDDSAQATGYEEPTNLYSKGYESSLQLPFDMAEAQHFAFLYGYHLGGISTAAYGTGYKQTLTKSASRVPPTFTVGDRVSNTPFIVKRRFAGFVVDQVKTTLAKGSWAKIEGTCKGTGKFEDTLVEETVAGFYDDTTVTLAANPVQGGTAPLRLDNVHSIKVQKPVTLEWEDVVFSAVSAATPAVITITAPGVAHTATSFKVLYMPAAAAWETFPSRLVESPLWVANLSIKVGGLWDGSSYLGGHSLGVDVKSIEHTSNRKSVVEQRPASGATGTYANYAQFGALEQSLSLDKEMRDFILGQRHQDLENMMVEAYLIGAEFESGKNYYVKMLWPKVSVIEHDISVDGKVVMEKGSLKVMEHATYGSIRVEVATELATVAA